MYIARMLYPVEVLGPGKRIGIWTCGCPLQCDGCANPELWETDDTKNVAIDVLLDLVKRIAAEGPVDGFTITGGEPFYQPEELQRLLAALVNWSEDILVFTGYRIEEISSVYPTDNIAVLVDGPYCKERNTGLKLRGSDNQKIHVLKKKYENLYRDYLSDGQSEIQNFMDGNSVISVGIHRPGYREEMRSRMMAKGLEEGGVLII